MSARLALVVALFAVGCSRKPVPVDAEARALSDAVVPPALPSESAAIVQCPSTRIIVSKDAIHVTNAIAFAALDAEQRNALLAQASEDERYGLPLVARNVMRISDGAAASGGGHYARGGALGPLRPVLEFAREIARKIDEKLVIAPYDERADGVEILADESTPVGLLFDVAWSATLVGLKPSLRVRDGGGMSCTTLLLSARAGSSGKGPIRRFASAAVRVERKGTALRGCRVLEQPTCDALDKVLRTVAGPKDPCDPVVPEAETFTLLETPDDVPLAELLGAFRDAPLAFRAFVLAVPGNRELELFRRHRCNELADVKPIDLSSLSKEASKP